MQNYLSLIEQAQCKDNELHREHALNELTRHYQGEVYSQAYRIVKDRQLALEIMQETFLTMVLRINELENPRTFFRWLRKIVREHSKQVSKRETRSRYVTMEVSAENINPEHMIQERELIVQLDEAMNQLSRRERAVIEGFYLGNESQLELAERLQLPVTTVKKRLQYARRRLKGLLLCSGEETNPAEVKLENVFPFLDAHDSTMII